MRLFAPVVLIASLLAAPAMAGEDQPTPTATPTAKPVKPKRICRVDTALGSVMPRYVCHSKEEWHQIDAATASAADNAQNGMGNNNSGSRNSPTSGI